MNIAVIGAGVSGLSSAKLLVEKGYSVTVFEKASKPGGLIKCDIVDGALFHRVGGHVFNAKNTSVFNWFWKQFNQEVDFLRAKRNAKIFMDAKYIGYPLENYIYQLDEATIKEFVNDILVLSKKGYTKPLSYDSFEDFLIGNFGKTLYQKYFKPYNEKIWRTDLSKVALQWLDGKLPMPQYIEMLQANILRAEEDNMVHSTFFYPKNQGSQFIANRLSEGINVEYNTEVDSIIKTVSGWKVNEDKEFDVIFYTGDIRCLGEIIKISNVEINRQKNAINNLLSNGTSNILCYTDETDLSWLYLPEKTTAAHRIIYTGNFSKSNNAPGQRKTCTVEFSGNVSVADMQKQIIKLPGNLQYIAYNYEPNSYVVQQKGDKERIANLKALLSKENLYLVGRFAEWEYHNMDKAIESAMHTVNSNFKLL